MISEPRSATGNKESLLHKGEELRQSGNLQGAIKLLRSACDMYPNEAGFFAQLSHCYIIKDNLVSAEKCLMTALELDPQSSNVKTVQARLLLKQQKVSQALDIAQTASHWDPDDIGLKCILGTILRTVGELEESFRIFSEVLDVDPDCTEALINRGMLLLKRGEQESAIQDMVAAHKLRPDLEFLWEPTIALAIELGEHNKAVQLGNEVLKKKANYKIYGMLGLAFQNMKKFRQSEEAYVRAISISSEYADAYNNLGTVLKAQGKLSQAVEIFQKYISLKPNNAEGYNNMGTALLEQGEVKQAIEFYNQAVALQPDYAEAYWNLVGTANSISVAKHWVSLCLKSDKNHQNAVLTMIGLSYYEGDKSAYVDILTSNFKESPFVRTYTWAFTLPELPPLYFNRWALFDHMLEVSDQKRPFYEFGVWRGVSFRYLLNTLKKGYGFDTFEGLPEDWDDLETGTYSSDGTVPQLDGAEFIAGKFEDTLPGFFAEERPMASIINFDADLYSSTICALNYAKPVIDKHTILIFDEFIMNKNWEQDEYKALEEFCSNNDYTYEVLAISFFTKQVAVKIVGI